jgi:hypothetical protein
MKRDVQKNKVQVMKQCTTSDQINACRAFALERNSQLFEEAQALNRAAYNMLEGQQLDAELFDRYQAIRRKADVRFEEAIEHLRLLNEDFPSMPMSINNSQDLRQRLHAGA